MKNQKSLLKSPNNMFNIHKQTQYKKIKREIKWIKY